MTILAHRHRAASRVGVRPAEGPVTLPRSDAATLAAVEALIEDSVASLHELWADLARTVVPRPGVLHTDSVLELLDAMIGSGGKRLRPRMCHWGWVAAGGARDGRGHDDMVRAAAALELLHVFALIHDDVMDSSDSRRGLPSVHVQARHQHVDLGGHGDPGRYGENIAILVGDLAHSEADVLMAGLPPRLRAIWRTLTVELMLGQGRDLVGAANGRRDLVHAREIARVKSGAYTVWRPLQLGAAAAGASSETLDALNAYGQEVGVAFALRDDILGVLGDPHETGKPVGDDLVQGKPTVLMALATQRFSPTWRAALERTGTDALTERDVAGLQAELVRSGVIAEVEAMVDAAVQAASRALDTPAVDPAAAEGLRGLARRIGWRVS
jgi:geranylgeranyl diphosphate synthase, type I